MSGRDPLLGALATMWDRADPVPDDLVERLLVMLALQDLDMEYELLDLVSRSDRLAGTRSSGDVLTLSFEGADFSMVLRVSRTGPQTCRIDGWLTPPRPLTVTATQGGESVDARVDQSGGRFELGEVRIGPTRFLLGPEEQDPPGPTLATPPVDL